MRLKVEIIVTGGGATTRAGKQATTTIPIVMTQDGDPVANGFVASLARPGGNITGLATLVPELSGKRLELLKESSSKDHTGSFSLDFRQFSRDLKKSDTGRGLASGITVPIAGGTRLQGFRHRL